MRHKAVALSSLGHNQLADLSEPASRFLNATLEHMEDVSISRLWSRGNTLRSLLKAHDTAVGTGDPTNPAILSTSTSELLRDLVETFNVFIVGDPDGLELDQVRLGPQERSDATVTVGLVVSITEAAETVVGLATPAAIDALNEQVKSARTAPAGIDGDQAVSLSIKTSGNFVIELLRNGYAKLLAEPGFASKEVRAGLYRGVGALAALPIISFVASNAETLTAFVVREFHNPTLVQIIQLICKRAASIEAGEFGEILYGGYFKTKAPRRGGGPGWG